MTWIEILSFGMALLGLLFFAGGTAGILRFPDLESKLHALTKADNLGLGFILIAIGIRESSADVIIKLFIIWFVMVTISAALGYIIGQESRRYKEADGYNDPP